MSATAKPAANGDVAPQISPLDVLTLAQAAAYLQLAADVVRAEAEAGRLPGRRVAGEWRFSRAALIEWLSPTPTAAEWPPPAPFGPWSPEAEREAEAEIARLAAARRGTPKRGRARSPAQ
ncbi:MAG: helix-turn-helix domain-containing protein [Gemmataceae bacterium]